VGEGRRQLKEREKNGGKSPQTKKDDSKITLSTTRREVRGKKKVKGLEGAHAGGPAGVRNGGSLLPPPILTLTAIPFFVRGGERLVHPSHSTAFKKYRNPGEEGLTVFSDRAAFRLRPLCQSSKPSPEERRLPSTGETRNGAANEIQGSGLKKEGFAGGLQIKKCGEATKSLAGTRRLLSNSLA